MSSAVDAALLAPAALFGIFGAARGALRSTSNLAAWLLAPLITLYAYPHAERAAESVFESELTSSVVALSVPFVFSLLLLQMLFGMWMDRVRRHVPRPLDHGAGAVSGAAVGLAVAALAWTIINNVVLLEEMEFVKGSAAARHFQRIEPRVEALLEVALPSALELLPERADERAAPTGPSSVPESAPARPSLVGGGDDDASETSRRLRESVDALLQRQLEGDGAAPEATPEASPGGPPASTTPLPAPALNPPPSLILAPDEQGIDADALGGPPQPLREEALP